MARPAPRGRRVRDEDEPPSRRGRGTAPRKASGPPMGVLLGCGALVVLAAVVGIVASGKPKETKPAPAPVSKAPPPKEPSPVRPAPPEKPPPKPLTADERTYIEGLFRRAQPHIESFRQHAREGWTFKEKGDNDAANEEWIDAKHEFRKAVEIVSEALEDEDRFPSERPGMDSYNGRLATWTKEMAALPKVNVTR